MGYYTYYDIDFSYDNDAPMSYDEYRRLDYALGEALAEINPNYFWDSDCLTNQIEEESMKWYEYDADMRKLSERFPYLIFTLDGKGEDSEDLWRAHYYKGKSQLCRAKIVYEPFDMEKLVQFLIFS